MTKQIFDREFAIAVGFDNVPLLKSELEKHDIHVNAYRKPVDYSIVHYAVRDSALNVVQWLLTQGANPYQLDKHSRSAMTVALSMPTRAQLYVLLSPLEAHTPVATRFRQTELYQQRREDIQIVQTLANQLDTLTRQAHTAHREGSYQAAADYYYQAATIWHHQFGDHDQRMDVHAGRVLDFSYQHAFEYYRHALDCYQAIDWEKLHQEHPRECAHQLTQYQYTLGTCQNLRRYYHTRSLGVPEPDFRPYQGHIDELCQQGYLTPKPTQSTYTTFSGFHFFTTLRRCLPRFGTTSDNEEEKALLTPTKKIKVH